MFKQWGRNWVVLTAPKDLERLAAAPRDSFVGGTIKHTVIPWITRDVLPGMPDAEAPTERRNWTDKFQKARRSLPVSAITTVTSQLSTLPEGEPWILSRVCSRYAIEVAKSLFGANVEPKTFDRIAATGEPLGTQSIAISKWLTMLALQRSCNELRTAFPSLNDRPSKDAKRLLMMYAGFIVGLQNGMCHMFAELLRSDTANIESIRDETTNQTDPNKWSFCQAVADESLRRSPNLVLIPRETLRDVMLDDRLIPQGTIVATCPYLTHHRAELFPSPSNFDPSRFYLRRRPGRFEYYPFGFDSRSCPVNTLARDLLAIILGEVISHFHLQLVDEEPNPVSISRCLLVTTRANADKVIARPIKNRGREIRPEAANPMPMHCPFANSSIRSRNGAFTP